MSTNNYFGQDRDKSVEGLSVTQVLRPMPVCHFKTLQIKHVWNIPDIWLYIDGTLFLGGLPLLKIFECLK